MPGMDVSKLQVYTGKQGDTSEKGLGAKVVKDLCCDLQSK